MDFFFYFYFYWNQNLLRGKVANPTINLYKTLTPPCIKIFSLYIALYKSSNTPHYYNNLLNVSNIHFYRSALRIHFWIWSRRNSFLSKTMMIWWTSIKPIPYVQCILLPWGVKVIQLVCTMYHFKEVKNKQTKIQNYSVSNISTDQVGTSLGLLLFSWPVGVENGIVVLCCLSHSDK